MSTKFRNLLARLHGESGATAVEYGIMVALIAAVIIGAVLLVGTETQGSFQDTADCLATPSSC